MENTNQTPKTADIFQVTAKIKLRGFKKMNRQLKELTENATKLADVLGGVQAIQQNAQNQ